MGRTPHDALAVLRTKAADGSLATLCERLGIELLVIHGSAVREAPLSPPQDLDVAFRATSGPSSTIVEIIDAFIDATQFDDIDMMDHSRADDVARARALGPHSVLLYEASPSTFALAQIAAITTEMETRYMRRRDLELMAGR